MSSFNPLLSNGTCYFSAGKRSDQSFIPCGNDALGRITCCGVNDNCLGNQACFNGAFGLTYLAGCTDPEYKHDSCPSKGDLEDLPWTGLVYCNGTSNQWMACDEKNKPSALRRGDFCFCPSETESRRVVFSAPSTLVNVASLPPKISSSVRFENGFVPIQEPGQTTVTILPPTGTAKNSPQETNPANRQGEAPSGESDGGGLSTGAKAGIGAGVGAVALLALTALVLLFMRRRKQAAGTANEEYPDNGIVESPPPQNDNHLVFGFGDKTDGRLNNHLSVASSSHRVAGMLPGAAAPTPSAVSELESNAARPWSMRSELQGSENIAAAYEAQPMFSPSEQPTRDIQPVTPVTPEPPQPSSHYPGFRPYRSPGDPYAASAPVSPVPGSLAPGGGVSIHQQLSLRPGTLSPVHELP